jgi:hypothetical protein
MEVFKLLLHQLFLLSHGFDLLHTMHKLLASILEQLHQELHII